MGIGSLFGDVSKSASAGRRFKDLGTTLKDVVKRYFEQPEIKYKDIPIIDPKDLVGAKIGTLPADLLKTGDIYKGIDAAGTSRFSELTGGPLYGALPRNVDAGLAFASEGKAPKAGADLYSVSAMGQGTHRSNLITMDNVLGTIEAYMDTGRIDSKALKSINAEISNYGKMSKNKDAQRLADFPGFQSENIDEYMDALSFDARKILVDKLAQPGMQKLGVPNIGRILDETMQKEFAGVNPMDSLLLIKPDNKFVNLAKEGLPTNRAYSHGIGGEIVGKFNQPVNWRTMNPEFFEKYGVLKGAPRPLNQFQYTFERALPTELMTKNKAELITRTTDYEGLGPRKALLLRDGLNNRWRTSGVPVKEGGFSTTQFSRNLENSASFPSLEPYSPNYINEMVKSGKFKAYGLGDDSSIQFALNKDPDYSWMGIELGPNEVDLVGVVSNELGAGGVASPAVLGKAIEEGATVLNAFAVKSEKFPKGKLNTIYKRYGFKPIKSIAFDSKYYINERGQAAYDDLIRQWKVEGWDESMGMPEVVAMKWTGTDKERIDATRRVLDKSWEGFGGSKASVNNGPSTKAYGQRSSSSSGEKRISGEGDGGRDSRNLRNDNGSSQSNRIGTDTERLKNLTDIQLDNLGLGALPKGPQ